MSVVINKLNAAFSKRANCHRAFCGSVVFFVSLLLIVLPLTGIASGVQEHGNILRLKQGDFTAAQLRGDAKSLGFSLQFVESGKVSADGYAIVHFDRPVRLEDRHWMSAAGARIVRALPYNGYILYLPAPDVAEKVRRHPAVDVLCPLHPWFRIDPRIPLILEKLDSQGLFDADEISLRLTFFPDEPYDGGPSLALELPYIKKKHLTWPGSPLEGFVVQLRIEVVALYPHLVELSRLPGLEMLAPAPRMELKNDSGIWVHQSFSSGSTPVFSHGLTGYGQIAAVSDSGLDEDECYFYDPSGGYSPIDSSSPFTDVSPDLSKRKVILYLDMGGDGRGDADSMGPAHGTHTMGSVLGDNYAHPASPTNPGRDTADGMAPAAKLVAQDLGGSLQYLNNGGTFAEVLESAYQAGARIHSNSWGASCCDFALGCFLCINYQPLQLCNVYDDFARDADLKMWEHQDMLVFVAAGNDGDCGALSIGTPATAKNIVTVGATEHGTSANSKASFSGQGNTYDGRLKPTVMGQGNNVVSAAGDNSLNPPSCATRTMGGTSMACPTIAGNAILARQYFTDGYYPSGAATLKDRFIPSGALIKATLINSARDMTGVSGAIPNSLEGYGRVTLDDTLYFSGDSRNLLVVDSWAAIQATSGFDQSGAKQFSFELNSTNEPLKVTLVWTDPPAALAANPALINDLDLSLITPAKQLITPNTAQSDTGKSGNAQSATRDSKNVVEQILLSSPSPGTYIAKVDAVTIAQGTQHFALVISGGGLSWQAAPPQNVPALAGMSLAILLLMLTLFFILTRVRPRFQTIQR